YIPPRIFWIPGMISLAFPFLIIASLVLGFIYLSFLKKRGFIFFAAILLNWVNIANFIQFNKTQTPIEKNKTETIHLLSYNVNLFDYYAILDHNKSSIRNEIIDFIETENADVVCLQEYYESVDGSFPIAPILKENADLLYHNKMAKNKKCYFGNVIFSKFPIIQSGEIPNVNRLAAIYVDIVRKTDTFRIYNMHLESNKLDNEDHLFYTGLTSSSQENANIKEGTIKIIKKLRHAAIERSAQMKNILAHIAQSPYPVVLSGDMNDNPVSYVYHKACTKLNDSFCEKGQGFGHTYQGIFPSYRIDYILTSKNIETLTFSCLDVDYSDHCPITSSLLLPSEK
ncbi:MAG: endonuclease/exonuclease/phosphatase family protein, partial [Bacteroidales bacterium]